MPHSQKPFVQLLSIHSRVFTWLKRSSKLNMYLYEG